MVDALLERGRHDSLTGSPEGARGQLALLRFADLLRRSADRLCHESAMAARNHGASWREIGEAVGGITPQGCGTSVQPGSQGASIEDVQEGMGRQRTQS